MVIEVTFDVTDVYISTTVSPVYVNVSFESPSGGAAVWGGITGTLSNQTDLQNALNAKFDDPTGTTSQYLRGDGSLATFPAIPSGTVSSVGLTMPSAFSVANSPITSSGALAVTGAGDTTQYIAGDGSLVAFPITGQAGTLVREVRNVTGATLTKGTVVYINGASGNKPTVAKAIATSDATSAQTFGLIQADIPNNSNGYLVAFGDLDGLNTSAFAEGVQLYLSATTAGGYTSTKQYAPNHLVYIGVVTRQHVNQGCIEVRIQNGYEMDELHDVAAQTPSNNDGLFYNSTNSLWENKSIATALGYTPANAATTLTINGVTYDLSANRSWTVSAGISGSGASGQVAYWTGTTSQTGSNNLFWDNANGRLGIGTNTPAFVVDVAGNVDGIFRQHIKNSSTGTSAQSAILLRNNADTQYMFGVTSTSYTTAAGLIANDAYVQHNDILNTYPNSGLVLKTSNANPLKFQTNNVERGRFFAGGNFALGSTTDTGERLQVTGTMKVTGDVAVDVNVLYVDTTNNRVGIGTASPTRLLDVAGTGQISTILTNTISPISGTITINSTTNRVEVNGTNFDGYAFAILNGTNTRGTGGNQGSFSTTHQYAPTSGSLQYNGINIANTINQTGTANGITRGLYVNPTLTSAADFRAIETTNGKVIFGNLPTSSAGLPTGAIWNDAGTIKIV